MTRDILEDNYSKTLELFENWYVASSFEIQLSVENSNGLENIFYELPTIFQIGVFMRFFSGANRETALSRLIQNELVFVTDTDEYDRIIALGLQFLEENGYV